MTRRSWAGLDYCRLLSSRSHVKSRLLIARRLRDRAMMATARKEEDQRRHSWFPGDYRRQIRWPRRRAQRRAVGDCGRHRGAFTGAFLRPGAVGCAHLGAEAGTAAARGVPSPGEPLYLRPLPHVGAGTGARLGEPLAATRRRTAAPPVPGSPAIAVAIVSAGDGYR